MGRKGQYISFRRDMTMFVGPTIIANDNCLRFLFQLHTKMRSGMYTEKLKRLMTNSGFLPSDRTIYIELKWKRILSC